MQFKGISDEIPLKALKVNIEWHANGRKGLIESETQDTPIR